MKIIISIIFVLFPSLISLAQQPLCKVVAIDSNTMVVTFNGKNHKITGESISLDDLIYRVEPNPASLIQQVYIWEVTEFVDLENEFGKYYSFKGHRVEFSPNESEAKLLQGWGFGFWGKKSNKRSKIVFNIKKFDGFAPFANAQEVRFDVVGEPPRK